MSDWLSGIPPPVLLFLFIAALLVLALVLKFSVKIIEWFYEFLTHGLWILFGGKPSKAPERAKSNINEGKGGGGPWGLLLVIVALVWFAITILQILQGSFWVSGAFFGWSLIIGCIALLYAGLMQLYVTSKKKASNASVRRQTKVLVQRTWHTKTPEEIRNTHEAQKRICASCSKDILGAYYVCEHCGAIFCIDNECRKTRGFALKCPMCGKPWRESWRWGSSQPSYVA